VSFNQRGDEDFLGGDAERGLVGVGAGQRLRRLGRGHLPLLRRGGNGGQKKYEAQADKEKSRLHPRDGSLKR